MLIEVIDLYLEAGPMDDVLLLLIYVAVVGGFAWAFYKWGASIAEKKGRSRSLGWWSAVFGLMAILVLALLPSRMSPSYLPASSPRRNVTEELSRLAALRDRGALTDDEFNARKRALLG